MKSFLLLTWKWLVMFPLGIIWYSFAIAFSPLFIAVAFFFSDSREESLECLKDMYFDSVIDWWNSLFEL